MMFHKQTMSSLVGKQQPRRQQDALTECVRLMNDRHRLAWMPRNTSTPLTTPPQVVTTMLSELEQHLSQQSEARPGAGLPRQEQPPTTSLEAIPPTEKLDINLSDVIPTTHDVVSELSAATVARGAPDGDPAADSGQLPPLSKSQHPAIGWFSPISRLGPELLDGVYGPVCVDVRVHGRLASQFPEALDDYVDKIISGLVDGQSCLVVDEKATTSSCSSSISTSPIEVFCWMVSSGHAFEVTPFVSSLLPSSSSSSSSLSSADASASGGTQLCGMPPVVFLAALLASPTVRTVAVHLKPILRLVAALLGTASCLAPKNCVDLGLVDSLLKPFGNSSSCDERSSSSLSLMYRLAALVDEQTIQRWRDDATSHMKRHRDESELQAGSSSMMTNNRHRGLDVVECNFLVMAHAYCAASERIGLHVASYGGGHYSSGILVSQQSPTSTQTNEDHSGSPATIVPAPIDLDIHCEWETVCMNIRGLCVDVDAAQHALDALKNAAEERMQRFVAIVTELKAPEAATIPPLCVDDFFVGRLEPSTAWLFLGCPRPLNNSVAPPTAAHNEEQPMVGTVPLHEAPVEDAMSLIEETARLPPLLSAVADASKGGLREANNVDVVEAAVAYMEATALTRHADEVASWVRRFAQKAPPSEWRVHATWMHKADTTGRVFASKPNVQTLPKRIPTSGWLPESILRKCVVVSSSPSGVDQSAAADQQQQTSSPPILRWILRGPRGTVLIAVDYSQIELRVCAHLSGDASLLSVFQSSRGTSNKQQQDVFLGIADILFSGGTHPDKDDGDRPRQPSAPSTTANADANISEPRALFAYRRQAAKTIVYSILYGMSNEGIATLLASKSKLNSGAADALGWAALFPSEHAAFDIVQRFFRRFPQVTSYLQSVCDEARRVGAVRGVLRTRFIDTPFSNHQQHLQQQTAVGVGGGATPSTVITTPKHRGGGATATGGVSSLHRTRFDRSVVSVAIQGSAADMIKLAMYVVEQRCGAAATTLPTREEDTMAAAAGRCSAALVSSAHDELVFAVPTTHASETSVWLREQLESIGTLLSLKVPLEAHTTIRGYLC